eukprot:CAMPEP_0175301634 /NCGR_PEP_ID=MMETSP0093-20121207/61741_1 /TAXON_ID=311494 /ORGANISM="Alexandrium monilatum, Strain CCMP3105" /LENGTH=67 /DNA_ID=CAMNT_0016597859 /DNA_START=25 /DNA_END=226 /DNA_ORIENTATION=-
MTIPLAFALAALGRVLARALAPPAWVAIFPLAAASAVAAVGGELACALAGVAVLEGRAFASVALRRA